MKALGTIMIIIGIMMFVYTKLNIVKVETRFDLSASAANIENNQSPQWPVFAGVGFGALGLLFWAVGNRKYNLIVPADEATSNRGRTVTSFH